MSHIYNQEKALAITIIFATNFSCHDATYSRSSHFIKCMKLEYVTEIALAYDVDS